MSTLATVRGEIKTNLILANTDYDGQIDNEIRAAIRRKRGKRFWFLKKTGTKTLPSGDSSFFVPSDFAIPSRFRLLDSNGRWRKDGEGFDYMSLDQLQDQHWTKSPLDSSTPIACALEDNQLHFSHLADVNYTISLTYYRKDSNLPQADDDTSVWFDEGYDVIRTDAERHFKHNSPDFTKQEKDDQAYMTAWEALQTEHENREAWV